MLLVISSPNDASEGYVIIDAMRLPITKKQPTWIALQKHKRLIHIPTGQTMTSLPFGKYTINHIDYGKDKRSGTGTIHSSKKIEDLTFEVKSDSIAYIGMLQVNYIKKRKYSVGVEPTQAMISWACESHSNLLSRLPLRIKQVDEYKNVSIQCDTAE